MAFDSLSMAYLPQEEPTKTGEVCAFPKQGGEKSFCLKKMLQGIYHQKKQQYRWFGYNPLFFPAFNRFYLTSVIQIFEDHYNAIDHYKNFCFQR